MCPARLESSAASRAVVSTTWPALDPRRMPRVDAKAQFSICTGLLQVRVELKAWGHRELRRRVRMDNASKLAWRAGRNPDPYKR
jgi:hypothetical protein